jgi:hypothetical protein
LQERLVTVLRDPMARTLLALLAICVTVTLFLLARRRKRLSYSISNTRVLGLHEAVNPSRVTILFDGAPVTQVSLVIIKINNWGNEPIRADDFERPLRFSWSEPARILSAEVTEVNPETLRPTIRAGAHEIVLDPLLLNPGDWLQLKILINEVGNRSVDGRVIGVKRITKINASDKVTSDKTLRFVAAMGALGSLTVLVISGGQDLGLWKENGRAELWIVRVFVLVMLFALADQLKASVLGLIFYFRDKDGSLER